MWNKIKFLTVASILVCQQCFAQTTFFSIFNSAQTLLGNRFFNITNSLSAGTTENEEQISFTKSGGTLSNAKVYVTANTNVVTTTFDVVINSTVGNQSIPVTASSTGLFEDSDSDTISTSDEVNWEVTAAAWVSMAITHATVSFAPTTFHYIYYSRVAQDVCTTSGGKFVQLNGTLSAAVGSEVNAKLNMKIAGTLEKARIFVFSNAASNTNTIKSRINGADGNISVSITASTTGELLDSSNTDSISVDNDVNFTGSTSATGDINIRGVQASFTPSVSGSFMANTGTASGTTSFGNETGYLAPSGRLLSGVTTEAQAAIKVASDYTVSNLQTYILTNTGGDAGTIDFRLDTGGGPSSSALTMSITAATTGWFIDSVNSVSVSSTNKVDYRVVGPTSGSFEPTIISANFLAPADTSIKTVNGLANASVKTVNGLARASVKTVDGLA